MRYKAKEWKLGDELPFRDYSAERVLTKATVAVETPFEQDLVVIGCRNVLNEFGHQVRIRGRWYRRHLDLPIADKWPVLLVDPQGLAFCQHADAVAFSGDIVTGVPLVIEGAACGREFFLANCSDLAHTFEVHPQGRIGPSADAWRELSDAWQALKDKGESTNSICVALSGLAAKHGANPSRNVLHSALAETRSGNLMLVAMTNSLDRMATTLVGLDVQNAIVLDNGGSCGWFFCQKGHDHAELMLAGPNWRPFGSVFLVIESGFLQPRMHHAK